MGISFSGLTSDARVLRFLSTYDSHFMRTETLKSRMLFDRQLPVSRMVSMIAAKAQINTQRYGRRPYGVGLLVAGYDLTPRLFECAPDGTYSEYRAISIGSRAQSAKTYLEKNVDNFADGNSFI